MIKQKTLYSLRDISIIPQVSTDIESRSQCNPFAPSIEGRYRDFLPLIAAPMSCVYSDGKTYKDFWDNQVNCVIPRTVGIKERLELMEIVFCAFSLSEATDILEFPMPSPCPFPGKSNKYYVLLDMANGHMEKQIKLGKKLKSKFGSNIVLMGGNIANPKTYLLYEKAGFDFVRVGIGGGNGCLTSTNTGVHYPMASLISDISDLRPRNYKCKVIADGGIGTYSEVIKCLALGADYVMAGGIFTKATVDENKLGSDVSYYGMSTKLAQSEMGNTILKTSEGKFETYKKEYTLSGWVKNMEDYLRSAMSYCDSRNLLEFRKKVVCQVISPNSSKKINDK